jgi:UDP-glucose 4-epimerase
VWNVCDLLMNLLTNPAAPNHAWLVSDGEDLSTPDLLRRVGRAMRKSARLLPMPVGLLRTFGRMARLDAQLTQLCGSLTLDLTPTRHELEWHPAVSVDDALAKTVEWYLSSGARV